MNYRNKFTFAVLLLTLFSANIFAQRISNGEIKFDVGKMSNGASIDLSGNWFYRPDYAIKSGEKQKSADYPAKISAALDVIFRQCFDGCAACARRRIFRARFGERFCLI